MPITAISGCGTQELYPRVGAVRERDEFHRVQREPRPIRRNVTDPPITDKWWYPLWEKMRELDVPGMLHVSGSCNPNFHHTGAHYIATIQRYLCK